MICKGENYEGEESDAEGSDAEESDDTGKMSSKTVNLPQVVAINVVSSFTEKKNHTLLSGFIPTVLIDKSSFIITLFDCTKDILLISNKKSQGSFVTKWNCPSMGSIQQQVGGDNKVLPCNFS